MFFNRLALGPLLLALVVAIVFGVRWFSFSAALVQLEARGQGDLALAVDRLSAQMRRYRELAVLLSDHPSLMVLLKGGDDPEMVAAILQQKADQTGSLEIRLLARDGTVLASAGQGGNGAGAAPAYLPAFLRAMNGALGAAHYVNSASRRVFTFAAPMFDGGGPAVGAVLVTVDLSEIEWNWPSDPFAVFFTDANGVVYVTSRSELVLASYNGQTGRQFPHIRRRNLQGHELWRTNAERYLPREAIHLTRPMPVIGMTGEILIDTAPARRIANLQAAVAGALVLAMGLMLFLAGERRRALSARLELEAAANAALEARVAARTRQLSESNTALRLEVGEREDAQNALYKAQAELVRAGKLSALGQMSAGISHELNQPLMAIRSFAENAEAFLARGERKVAEENLSRISDLARRMGRIIQNLRAFARQERVDFSDVDLVGVVDAVLELSQKRLSDSGITLRWKRPDQPVMVQGGEVRLQQVLANLVSNAADAMDDSPKKRLRISITATKHKVRLTVADTGPGIDDPDKIFDPFYTTKTVGKSEGMGLGLSISYGLVQSFGGNIRGRNRSGGGAEFTVELAAAGGKTS
ncbi:MAG: sensor histidine kinase [Alphaproteobacteria bacterium]|nr:sensor histidine kinase [Alphaproteobacteria bacterium]